MTEMEDRMALLDNRIRGLEDRLDIYQMLACYGAAADSGSSRRAAQLWTGDGVYDLHAQVMNGQQDIVDELEGAWHQGLIHRGSAHVMGMPYITVDGDTAVATSQSRLYRREDDGSYKVLSCSANRWEFVRTGWGWRCARRTSRKLDGSPQSRDILARGIGGDGH